MSHSLLRMVYLRFYRPFGITPEEVGLGRTELLLQTLAGPVLIIGMTAFYVLGLLTLALLVLAVVVLLTGTYFEWLLHRARRDEKQQAGQPGQPREPVSAKAAARERRLQSFYRASGVDVDVDASPEQRPNPFAVCFHRWFRKMLDWVRACWGWVTDREHRRYVLLVSVALLVTTVSAVITGTGLARVAEEKAHEVIRSGEPVYVVEVPLLPTGAGTVGVLPALQLRAIPARVSAPVQTLPDLPQDPGGVLYLGSDGEYLLLYVPDSRRTVRLPVGEVALDLETEPDPPLAAELDGEQVVGAGGEPGAGDPEASGSVEVTISPFRELACYKLTHELETAPTGLHIGVGGPEEAGEVVMRLFPPAADTDEDARAALASAVPSEGCAPVAADLAAAILSHPERYYVQAHTGAPPAAAMRGQLEGS